MLRSDGENELERRSCMNWGIRRMKCSCANGQVALDYRNGKSFINLIDYHQFVKEGKAESKPVFIEKHLLVYQNDGN